MFQKKKTPHLSMEGHVVYFWLYRLILAESNGVHVGTRTYITLILFLFMSQRVTFKVRQPYSEFTFLCELKKLSLKT